MKATRESVCPRCDCIIPTGADIKLQFVPGGVKDGKMTFRSTGKFVHAGCKTAKPRPQRYVDPTTGEIQ